MYFVIAARTIANLIKLLRRNSARALYAELEQDEVFSSYDAALKSVDDPFTEFECEQVGLERIYVIDGKRIQTNFIIYKWLDNEPEPYVFTVLNADTVITIKTVP